MRSWTGKWAPWQGPPPEPPLGPDYELFLANGDHLGRITRVCTLCGAVVATNYTGTHRRVCPGNVTQTTG